MLDQCHNIEPKLPAMIRSVMNLQETIAKALLVDREALLAAQAAGDVLEANRLLQDAFATDVRPLLAELRVARGLAGRPVPRLPRLGRGRGARGGPRRRRGGGLGMTHARRARPPSISTEEVNVAPREAFRAPGGIMASIGDGGMRIASFDAAAGASVAAFDVRTTVN